MAPAYDGAGSAADNDQQLVARVRCGDDRAFEVLYHRYHRRIHAYVLGMVKDHGRAEDVTQEVFVSALRRMRETEQPLAFKPWLYQIAKNSCIDAFRRSKRAEEVSYDADDALAPSDHSRLVGSGPTPDAAVAAKLDLDNLCGAFGGLSDTHHEILVLRELEGLSYREIGRRMGMSRPAVESTLFRARRRLSEEYDDIVSGARCVRIRGIIVTATRTRLDARDTRRLAHHLAHCQPCRREALAAGLDRNLCAHPTVRERVAAKVAGVLPFPIFERWRRGGADATAATSPSGRGTALMSHLPLFAEQGWGKAAAGAAVLVAGVGAAGVGIHQHQSSADAPSKPAAVRSAPAAPSAPVAVVTARPTAVAPAKSAGAAERRRDAKPAASKRSSRRAQAPNKPSSVADRVASVGGGPTQTASSTSAGGAGSSSTGRSPVGGVTPPVDTNDAGQQTKKTVSQTTDAVKETTNTVRDTTQQVTDGVDKTVNTVTGGGGPVSEVVDTTTDTVDNTVDDVTEGVNQTVDQVTGVVNGIGGGGG